VTTNLFTNPTTVQYNTFIQISKAYGFLLELRSHHGFLLDVRVSIRPFVTQEFDTAEEKWIGGKMIDFFEPIYMVMIGIDITRFGTILVSIDSSHSQLSIDTKIISNQAISIRFIAMYPPDNFSSGVTALMKIAAKWTHIIPFLTGKLRSPLPSSKATSPFVTISKFLKAKYES